MFKTDHPGLQQVNDAVKELGITRPVVPTWLPEGYELKELKVIPMPTGRRICANFVKNKEYLVLLIKPYDESVMYKYEKDESEIVEYGIAGITHYVMQNDGNWLAVWSANGNEFSVSTNHGKEVLYTILESIYMEVEK